VFASSSPAKHLEDYLQLLNARALRERATTSDDVERTKPEPDLIEAALGLAGTRSALLVGDSTHDARAAERAGIGTICLLTGGYCAEELLEAGALAVYETPADLIERLDELRRLPSTAGRA
jgi:phosphoglycolate phosphatase-like HAD superfamily hydrolase